VFKRHGGGSIEGRELRFDHPIRVEGEHRNGVEMEDGCGRGIPESDAELGFAGIDVCALESSDGDRRGLARESFLVADGYPARQPAGLDQGEIAMR
jgi:hypothetical protein